MQLEFLLAFAAQASHVGSSLCLHHEPLASLCHLGSSLYQIFICSGVNGSC